MRPRQVTPEEEVADLKAFLDGIKQFPDDDTHRYETDRGGVIAILAAIRAAENDALERAAAHYDQEATTLDESAKKSGGVDEAFGAGCYRDAAEFARALKHKEAE